MSSGRRPSKDGLWKVVLHAIDDTARTVRLIAILIVLLLVALFFGFHLLNLYELLSAWLPTHRY